MTRAQKLYKAGCGDGSFCQYGGKDVICKFLPQCAKPGKACVNGSKFRTNSTIDASIIEEYLSNFKETE